MNILFCSVGRRGELLKDFRKSMGDKGKIVATDLSPYAPALYFADKVYLTPRIDDPVYLDTIVDICKKEEIDAVTTVIDPEIEILAKNRNKFKEIGVEVLAPYEATAKLCFDKFAMYEYLVERGLPTVLTFDGYDSFKRAFDQGRISLPIFVKPRNGSGSVGARKISTLDALKAALETEPSLIVQEYMDGEDLDADVYVDTISHEAVAIFSKKKISTTIGGANKTISFKDEKLFCLIKKIVQEFKFNGPIDMDFFKKNGEYYLSEINPRFGGAYLHAYGAGVDFVKLIENNLSGKENDSYIGEYDENVVMMMYDSVVIKKQDELIS